MNRLILSLVIAAFATVTSLHAGDQCAAEKKPVSATTACSAATKAACSSEVQAACSAAKPVAVSKSCCATEKVVKAKKRIDVKGATLLVQRR